MLKWMKFHLNMRGHLFTVMVTEESPLEILKTYLYVVLCNVL